MTWTPNKTILTVLKRQNLLIAIRFKNRVLHTQPPKNGQKIKSNSSSSQCLSNISKIIIPISIHCGLHHPCQINIPLLINLARTCTPPYRPTTAARKKSQNNLTPLNVYAVDRKCIIHQRVIIICDDAHFYIKYNLPLRWSQINRLVALHGGLTQILYLCNLGAFYL